MFLLLGADNLNINLVEYIAVVEDVTMNDIVIELWDAYDESYAWDFLVELSLDVLNVEFSEDITVTEDIQMLDFVVELEVAEDILIGEVLDSFSLDVLYIEASDDILTEEAYDFNGAEFSEGDDLSVAEDVVVSLEELNTEVGSDTSISEDIVAELNELNLGVGDDASVSEDIVPDLEITFDAFESLTGEEALELDLTLTLDESDTVVVSEDYSYEVV
jgi:hypothetical protein